MPSHLPKFKNLATNKHKLEQMNYLTYYLQRIFNPLLFQKQNLNFLKFRQNREGEMLSIVNIFFKF